MRSAGHKVWNGSGKRSCELRLRISWNRLLKIVKLSGWLPSAKNLPQLRRPRLRSDDFAKKAGDGACVTGGARRFDLNQQRIAVAVEVDADDFLDVAAGGAFMP